MTVAFLSIGSVANTIPAYTVPKIEGGSQAISAFQGKKILFVTLPIIQNAANDSILYSLDTLAAAHQTELAVIAVPAFEDGFSNTLKASLQQWYRSKLGNYIVVTDGMYTRKSSGSQQHVLFKWLTTATQNESFDIDVEGPGYKYFVRANGELYGVLRTHVKIGSLAVNRTIRMQ